MSRLSAAVLDLHSVSRLPAAALPSHSVSRLLAAVPDLPLVYPVPVSLVYRLLSAHPASAHLPEAGYYLLSAHPASAQCPVGYTNITQPTMLRG